MEFKVIMIMLKVIKANVDNMYKMGNLSKEAETRRINQMEMLEKHTNINKNLQWPYQ